MAKFQGVGSTIQSEGVFSSLGRQRPVSVETMYHDDLPVHPLLKGRLSFPGEVVCVLYLREKHTQNSH